VPSPRIGGLGLKFSRGGGGFVDELGKVLREGILQGIFRLLSLLFWVAGGWLEELELRLALWL
jgi:hypothetical protein